WMVLGLFGVKFPVKILVAEEPHRHEIDPYVVKTNMARQVLIEPKYHVRWVHVPISFYTTDINERCEPFVEPLIQGWYKWLQSITISERQTRAKRDIVAKVLGGVGAGMGVANAIDNAHLSKSLAKLTTVSENLVHPLEESLLGLDKVQLKLTDLLPEWADSQERDHVKMLEGMQKIINDTALALACTQVQNMLFSLSHSIIHDSLAGHLPVEIATLTFERENSDLWNVLHAEYDPKYDVLHVVLLTVISAQKELIYPISTLGLNLNGSVKMKFYLHQNSEGVFEIINMQACMFQDHLGYVCTSNLWTQGHLCLNSAEGECNYELHSTLLGNNKSVVVQIDQHCVCIRSLCPSFTVNKFYTVVMPKLTNLCLIKGCDISVILINAEFEDITVRYAIIDTITPVSLGPSISAIKNMMEHPELKQIISDIKNASEKVHVVVQHSVDQIVQIGKKIHIKETIWSKLF
uniref:Uncharacterized protein n=1 Tax=Pelodiscus sinensis TaxID=13735 RepID=K7FYT3_PELSI